VSETFDPTWLALRERADHRSRAAELFTPLRAWWAAREGSRVLDLGAGTGSNLRYLAPELPGAQRWTLVDHDASLLALAEPPRADVRVRVVRGDVAREGLAEVARAHLVSASALLDLMSEAWLEALADACAAAECGALFALSYDGGIEWGAPPGARSEARATDTDPLDALVRDAVNEHQLRDKGAGPALGPAAGPVAERLFRARGYRTWVTPSPWKLTRADRGLADALVVGWAAAAAEQRPDETSAIEAWCARRRGSVASGAFELRVGHLDVLALPEVEVERAA